jgi:hypothetical protein
MNYKKYTVEHFEEGMIQYTEFTIKDLSDYFYQIRGFPSIVTLGKLSGEGQSGGRSIYNLAKELERVIIRDLGTDKYTERMSRLMGH